MFKTPYRAEAALCFQQLKGINELYKNTIDQILAAVNSEIPFREKLDQAVNVHIDNVEDPADMNLKKKKSAKEEDTYLCCFFDIIEGLFAVESETIVNSSFGGEQKKHAMDRMVRILNEVPLGGPRWNHNTQPRILRRLMDMKRQVHWMSGLLEDGRVKVLRGAVMEMQKMDYKKVRPSDYLKNGFFDPSGDWIEGLNGFYSMATAQLLREEGTSPAKVRGIADQLMALSLEVFGDDEILEYHSIDTFSRDAIFRIIDSQESKQSAVLSELFDTVRPQVKNWKNFAALVIHLEQISSQLDLVAA